MINLKCTGQNSIQEYKRFYIKTYQISRFRVMTFAALLIKHCNDTRCTQNDVKK